MTGHGLIFGPYIDRSRNVSRVGFKLCSAGALAGTGTRKAAGSAASAVLGLTDAQGRMKAHDNLGSGYRHRLAGTFAAAYCRFPIKRGLTRVDRIAGCNSSTKSSRTVTSTAGQEIYNHYAYSIITQQEIEVWGME